MVFDLFFCHYSLLASFACSMHAFSAQLAACMLADQMADSVIGWMRWIRWMVSWVGAHMEVGTHMVGTHMVGTNGGDHRCSTQKLG